MYEHTVKTIPPETAHMQETTSRSVHCATLMQLIKIAQARLLTDVTIFFIATPIAYATTPHLHIIDGCR